MVGCRPDGPRPVGQERLGVFDDATQRGGLQRRVDEHEVEAAVQLVAPVAVELHEHRQLLHVGLADEQALGLVGVGDGAPTAQDVVGLGTVGVVDGTLAHELLVEGIVLGGRRVVAQLLVLDHHVAHVDAEARHATVPPEAHDVVELAPDLLVPPVEVRLRPPRSCAGSTGRWARRSSQAGPPKMLTQLLGRLAVGLGVRPDVVVAVRRVPPAQRVDEPRVLVAGVVRAPGPSGCGCRGSPASRTSASRSSSVPKEGSMSR